MGAIPAWSRIVCGVVLPVVVFIAFQLALMSLENGNGSWDGINILFVSLFAVPGLLLLNLWVVPVRWTAALRALGAGLLLPAALGALELSWQSDDRGWNPAMEDFLGPPYVAATLCAVAALAPLVISLVVALRRR